MKPVLDLNSTHDEAVAVLASPDANVNDLWVAAERFPDLRPVVAAHPEADSELLEWLASNGDATVALIVGNRARPAAPPEWERFSPTFVSPSVTSSGQESTAGHPLTAGQPPALQASAPLPYVPTPPPPTRSQMRPLIIVGVVAVLAVAVALAFLLLPTSAPGPATDPTASPATSGTNSSTGPSEITKPSHTAATADPDVVPPQAWEPDPIMGLINNMETGIYGGPDTTYPVIQALHEYTIVELIGYMPGNSDFKYVAAVVRNPAYEQSGWDPIWVYGWVAANAITLQEKPVVWPETVLESGAHTFNVDPAVGLNLRAGPGSEYQVLFLMPQDSKVSERSFVRGGADGNWVFVRYELMLGWASQEYLTSMGGIAKPVVYLYPEQPTQVSVAVSLSAGEFTQTIPDYGDGWNVTAYPDGTLVNAADGQTYPYLFWEAEAPVSWDTSAGWVVAGTDTASFLRAKLAYLGMNATEIADFLEYWQPRLEANPYNLITFQTDAYEAAAALTITPQPDSVLRVFMAYAPLDAPVSLPPQQLIPWQREGFAAVEWGGGEIPSVDVAPAARHPR